MPRYAAEWRIIMDNKYFRLNVLTMAAAVMMLVSLIAAAIPATRRISEGVFEIGLPFSFFRVYASGQMGLRRISA